MSFEVAQPRGSQSAGLGRAAATEPRVVLVRPPMVFSPGQLYLMTMLPLGMAYVAGHLKSHGIPVSAVDAMGERLDQYRQDIPGWYSRGLSIAETVDRIDPGATIIGVSCMFSADWPHNRTLIRAIRARFPDSLIVAGGEHITAIPEHVLRDCPELDLCVLGQGERPMLEIVRRAGDREALQRIPGVAYLAGGEFGHKPFDRMRNPDEIGRPAWDLFPVEAYFANREPAGIDRGRSLPVLATRGCPYECTFCSAPTTYGRGYIAREPSEVLDELEEYIEKYGVEDFKFMDLTMILKRDWILRFCKGIEERGLQFTWQLPSGTRSEVIDSEVSKALYRTGCRFLSYAPESGSPETLKKIKKRVDLDRMAASIRAAVGQGNNVSCNIILGFPSERRRDILKSIRYAVRLAYLGVDVLDLFIFSPYPGSELFQELREDGTIPELSDDYFRELYVHSDKTVPTTVCKSVGARELLAWRWLAIVSFYGLKTVFHPVRFLRCIRNVLKSQSETEFETRVASILRRSRKVNRSIPRLEASASS